MPFFKIYIQLVLIRLVWDDKRASSVIENSAESRVTIRQRCHLESNEVASEGVSKSSVSTSTVLRDRKLVCLTGLLRSLIQFTRVGLRERT
jgi:hypothetical protein